jgi:IS4 transposase
VIAQLYKSRWNVELFFKWIKQNLRIKHFLGTSPPLPHGKKTPKGSE